MLKPGDLLGQGLWVFVSLILLVGLLQQLLDIVGELFTKGSRMLVGDVLNHRCACFNVGAVSAHLSELE